jgi:hypothetical protein
MPRTDPAQIHRAMLALALGVVAGAIAYSVAGDKVAYYVTALVGVASLLIGNRLARHTRQDLELRPQRVARR